MTFMEHPDPEVNRAIVRLAEALCSWKRSTRSESVLIVREAGGFTYRAVNGKPNVLDEVTDSELMKLLENK